MSHSYKEPFIGGVPVCSAVLQDCDLDKYIWKIKTNTFCNLDKYISQLRQILFEIQRCSAVCRWVVEAGGGIGNVPPGFMESAMGNPEQEELLGEKED